MIINGLLFDMDGVLVETEKFHYLAWKKAFKLKNINLSEQTYGTYCQAQGRHNAIKNILHNPTAEDYILLSDTKAQAYKEAVDSNNVILYDDAKELLAFLGKRSNIKLALASSSVVADYVIKKTDVAWQFSHFITGAMVQRNKPYPDIFNLAAAKLRLPKENLAVIEDSLAGVIAARLAGINVFAINRNNSLTGLNSINIEPHINELGLTLTDIELNNINLSMTIPISYLTDIIPYIVKST